MLDSKDDEVRTETFVEEHINAGELLDQCGILWLAVAASVLPSRSTRLLL